MAKIAISGGIGSGKSTLANALRSRGYQVLDADKLARDCLSSESVRAQISKKFPNFIGLNDLEFRRALASVVFSSREELNWLENLIHPCVKESIKEASKNLNGDFLFVEVPILAAASEYDLLIVVVAPEPTRVSRLLRKGYDQIDILNRMKSQPSQAEYSSKADLIFDGSLDEPEYTLAVSNLLSSLKGKMNG